MKYLVILMVGYCVIDFILGMILGRCVLPGLKCRACKEGKWDAAKLDCEKQSTIKIIGEFPEDTDCCSKGERDAHNR